MSIAMKGGNKGKELPPQGKSLERTVLDSGATPFFHKRLTVSDLVPTRGVQVSRVRCLPYVRPISCPGEPALA